MNKINANCQKFKRQLLQSSTKLSLNLQLHLNACPQCQKLYSQYKSKRKSPSSSTIPTLKIPGYRIQKKIGSGAMGSVYLAQQLSLKRPVALKILNDTLCQDARIVKRFLSEARALGKMKHPNLVQVYDVFFTQGLFFYVMEFVNGPSLKDILKKKQKLPPKKALQIIQQIAKALTHLQKHNIVHRDIKPGNILLDEDGTCKLADLGLAKIRWENQQNDQTAEHHIIGTPHYMAPEQVENSKNVDTRADIYALGATFYHLLTGHTLYQAKSQYEILAKILQEEPQFIPGRDDHVPENLQQIVLKMLAFHPEDRYQTPEELLVELNSLQHTPQKSHNPYSLALWGIALGALSTLITLLVTLLVLSKIFQNTPPHPPKYHPQNHSTKSNYNPNSTRKTTIPSLNIPQLLAKAPSLLGKIVHIPQATITKKYLKSSRKGQNHQITLLQLQDRNSQQNLTAVCYFPLQPFSYLHVGDTIQLTGKLTQYRNKWQISLGQNPQQLHKYLKKLQQQPPPHLSNSQELQQTPNNQLVQTKGKILKLKIFQKKYHPWALGTLENHIPFKINKHLLKTLKLLKQYHQLQKNAYIHLIGKVQNYKNSKQILVYEILSIQK
ncbi:MAG: serine/threonine protein kinase [Planctomycetota bacterium]|nr:MAG: serine/threonine protein kinase [Planctomycetota bacterium]